ncbi:glycoside hydrolase 15-related [Chthoniobacter flavus Ellin428]|uniref:Glycoside hydrolase 15-related n=1 Tax=Chthoniobacter flavus Ellin428 TaxID=497964 RepID=B4CZ96_9BACT|nr:glycoside hydrolase family 15 protein [Chthoniobacter flavus]EDY20787.1 glycoside hydrolase 15-related [Chthoniobacter flavus Ellin428]TCO89681.1 GH15 family glucan-1,4-alpha-glucosidase [Chthoniobacter flavus]
MAKPEPIENHGIVGDLHTIALVALDGTVDFFCFPRFDSPSVFAALLDQERGGHFRISPELNGSKHRQLYLPNSNVLLTRILSSEGVAEISDFMPVEEATNAHNLVRRVKSVRGDINFRMECAPRFNYARSKHRCERQGNDVIFTSEGPDHTVLRLHSSVPLRVENGDAIAEFHLHVNENASFVLEDGAQCQGCNAHDFVSESFKQTLNYWRRWIGHCKYKGRWQEIVMRSALTLKLLVSQPHGSLVAAPTFGLPEVPGGSRNWDYRYTWIRDAAFTIYALMRLGYTEEAGAFNRWVEQRCHEVTEGASLQIMYGIDGRHDLTEQTLDHFSGYGGARPVRIGNGAYDQLQLDILGELMDSIYLYDKWGEPISHALWRSLCPLLDWVCDHWQEPDEGIWETREGAQKFLYSRFMCWVALDRGIRMARHRSFPAPLAKWIEVRDHIFKEVHTAFWNKDLQAFVQRAGSTTVDASTLLMPLIKFIGPTDPQWLSTLKLIRERLVDDSLVHRYDRGDGTAFAEASREGTFNMCTFWYVECLARGGDPQQARYVFEKMLGYGNHLGLFGEETGMTGEQLGNFPQAFTHLGLISAAYALDRSLNTDS